MTLSDGWLIGRRFLNMRLGIKMFRVQAAAVVVADAAFAPVVYVVAIHGLSPATSRGH